MTGDLDDILEKLAAHPVWGQRMTIDERVARICAACARHEFAKLTDEGLFAGLEAGEPEFAQECENLRNAKDSEGRRVIVESAKAKLVAMHYGEPVATTTGVASTRYPVERKRDAEPKPLPGFELR